VLKLAIEGDFLNENKILTEGLFSNQFNGKISAEIAELKSFYRSYLNNRSIVANRLKYNVKSISLASDLRMTEGEFVLENFTIKSTLLDGSGVINLSKKDQQTKIVDIDLTLENIDLDSMWSNEIR